jgi:hypothetical protein
MLIIARLATCAAARTAAIAVPSVLSSPALFCPAPEAASATMSDKFVAQICGSSEDDKPGIIGGNNGVIYQKS